MSLKTNDKTEEVIEFLSDDESIRNWVCDVRDQNHLKDLPDKTCVWVKDIDKLNELKLDTVQWGRVVDFLLDNIT